MCVCVCVCVIMVNVMCFLFRYEIACIVYCMVLYIACFVFVIWNWLKTSWKKKIHVNLCGAFYERDKTVQWFTLTFRILQARTESNALNVMTVSFPAMFHAFMIKLGNRTEYSVPLNKSSTFVQVYHAFSCILNHLTASKQPRRYADFCTTVLIRVRDTSSAGPGSRKLVN